MSNTVAEFLPLVKYHAGRYFPHDFDAGYDACLDAAIRAVDTYDPKYGASLKTWVINCMKQATGNPKRPRVRVVRLMTNRDIVIQSAPDRHHTSYEDAQFLEWLLGHLDDRSRYVLESRNEGKTLEEIGQELGIGRERTRQIEEAATNKLRTIGERVI